MRANPLASDPGPAVVGYQHMNAPWPAKWIGPADWNPSRAGVWAFRLRLDSAGAAPKRVHVSADQRYELYLNGQRIGRGPERGDLRHWMIDTYELSPADGVQNLVAIIWWNSPSGQPAPAEAQQTVRPAFFCMTDGNDRLHSGVGPWEIKAIDGVAFHRAYGNNGYYAVEPRVTIDGHIYPWGIEQGLGDGWAAAGVAGPPATASAVWESNPYWLLRPAMLPAMASSPLTGVVCRHAESLDAGDPELMPVRAANHRADDAAAWNTLLAKSGKVEVPANARRRVMLDLKTYDCAFHRVVLSGGRDARVSVKWAESLFEFNPSSVASGNPATESAEPPPPTAAAIKAVKIKHNRSDIEGRHFVGYGDTFITDGRAGRAFDSLWWGAGRYVEVLVETKSEPLTIDALELTHTGYPYEFTGRFEASDKRLADVVPLALHTLQMCSHETSMDCPYYEQLNYVGDTRLQSLVAMTMSPDDRLVRKGIQLFDWSRTGDGWTSSRYPTRVLQTIPTFSSLWTTMVYDYALYRGDEAFLRQAMPGVRAVLESWRQQIDDRGLVTMPAGWNFIDWVKEWKQGIPNHGIGVHCGVTQWQLVYVFNLAAKLEDLMNEPLLARRHRQTAAALAAVAERTFFDEGRGLLADNEGKTQFSEHAQVLAIISGGLSSPLKNRVADALLKPRADLAQTSIYFSYYTFEALAQLGRVDAIVDRMPLWFAHREMGLSTLLESPEPSRSDCHAWGAHPVFHYFASFLGIRPTALGFSAVSIAPQLGKLEWVKGTMVHPKGEIRAHLEKRGGRYQGEIALPEGVAGTIHVNGETITIDLPVIKIK